MSAAELAERLASGGATVPGADFVPLCPQSRTGSATRKNDAPRGRNAVCALVPAVPAFSEWVETEREETRPDQAVNDTKESDTPDWHQADRAYLGHHFGCRVCCSAGKGYGRRCPTGLNLWTAYEAACEADRINNPNTRGRNPR